ncbi:MAG: chromosome segregation protein SMC [Rhodospirillaceae bacterium]|nr:chromosome segregation protein SMC [Rhodospirillaceae bacterium]
MQVTKLRVAGFKSFVEPTELHVEPGLTGIVGPNGCGKSNLVEAMRWVMGETAPRQMRGGGMEDVIFGGTARRPAYDIAAVTLSLDNADRRSLPGLGDAAEIEVTRCIERGEGSNYTVNGRDVRARDVQLLFADAATGAHSAALVGQGRIGDIIGAKPVQRRALLEEAAGITGLHARRHEAELKLRAAETNLERLQDVIGTLETQLRDLERQARHAKRYTRLSERIRETEAALLLVRWLAARARVEAVTREADDAVRRVAEATETAAQAASRQADAAAVLPERRQQEAEHAAALHRLRIEHERLAEEEERVARAREENAGRRAQIAADIEREQALAQDAEAAQQRLEEAHERLARAAEGDAAAEAAARAAREDARAEVEAVEQRLAALAGARARAEAERESLGKRIEETRLRRERLEHDLSGARDARAALERDTPADSRMTEAEAAEQAEAARFEAARTALQETETARAEAVDRERTLRETLRQADAALAGSEAERTALAALLDDPAAGPGRALWDRVTVKPGFEAAVGAALGDDLQASTDSDAPVHWRTLERMGDSAPLPEGVAPLADMVRAPEALAARLAQIGVVEEADGARLQSKLRTGQRLVSREGSLWRWDGFSVAAEAPTAAARRLEARNRLATLAETCAKAESEKRTAENDAAAAATARAKAEFACERARAAADEAAEALRVARETRASASAEVAAARSRLTALDETATRLERELAETGDAERVARAALDALPVEGANGEDENERLRTALVDLRAQHEEAARRHHQVAQAADGRGVRIAELARESEGWASRAASARRRLQELSGRRDEAEAAGAALDARPAELEARRAGLLGTIETAQGEHRAAVAALASAEREAKETAGALKQAEAALGEAREAAARLDGLLTEAGQAETVAGAQITERLGVAPEQAQEIAGIDPDAELPDAEAVEIKLQRLMRERENIGAVNLRAEEEARELDVRIREMQESRADLLEAIGRLRRGIAGLNREGRERILAAFGTIDGHFRQLFTELFAGGKAHLALVDSDDPLEAGLEVVASPPGKRPQSLSLLSGGEKALTAIALLFAAFLTNPAPICVLDEVDAPLDDSNVERFCTLIAKLAAETDTRFIVVTHHRITMARVDRLFGVTMVEQGVSELVSVDLERAVQLRESA